MIFGGTFLKIVNRVVSGFCFMVVLITSYSRMICTCMLPVSIVIVSITLVVSVRCRYNVSVTSIVSISTSVPQ